MLNLGKTIKKLREKAGLTPSEFARRSGFSLAYISKLESEKYKSLPLDTSKSLAEGLDMTLGDFLSELGYLENVNRPSLQLVRSALRGNGYSPKQVDEIMDYAEYIKNSRKS